MVVVIVVMRRSMGLGNPTARVRVKRDRVAGLATRAFVDRRSFPAQARHQQLGSGG